MRRSRFGLSLIAVGSLFFFTNMEMAVAAGNSDGTCTQSGGGGQDCGFLGLGCVVDAIGQGLSDVGNTIGNAVSSIDWSRIGRDAWAFGSNFVIGAVVTLGFIALGSALVAAGIVSAPVLAVIGIVLGVAGLAYLGYSIYKNHDHMSEADWFGLAGNITGGLVAGFGFGSAVSRGVSSVVGNLLGKDVTAIAAGAPKVVEEPPPAPKPVEPQPAAPVRPPSVSFQDAMATAQQVYNSSSGLKTISQLRASGANPAEVTSALDNLAAGIKAKYGLNIKYVPDNSVPRLSVRNPGTWSEADNTIYFNQSLRNNPGQWMDEFAHEYGAYLLGKAYGGKGAIPMIGDGRGAIPYVTHLLDALGGYKGH